MGNSKSSSCLKIATHHKKIHKQTQQVVDSKQKMVGDEPTRSPNKPKSDIRNPTSTPCDILPSHEDNASLPANRPA
jgi:hypothetical protein